MQLRQEAEQIQVDTDGGKAQLRSRLEENMAKLQRAARALHAVNLRAYYSTLRHFVSQKIPIALKIWEDRAARVAAEAELQAKTLEEVVFVAMPESEVPFFSKECCAHNDTGMPVVPYIDLHLGVPEIEAVLPIVRETGGVMIAFVAGLAVDMASMMEKEARFTKQVPDDAALYRVFVRASSQVGDGCGYVGYVSVVTFPATNGKASPLHSRVLLSPAITQGYLLNLPADSPDGHVRNKHGQDLCPEQRSTEFHVALLQGCSIVAAPWCQGQRPWIFIWLSKRRAPRHLLSSL